MPGPPTLLRREGSTRVLCLVGGGAPSTVAVALRFPRAFCVTGPVTALEGTELPREGMSTKLWAQEARQDRYKRRTSGFTWFTSRLGSSCWRAPHFSGMHVL
jgi:hypothetical protein